ncbi:uroporphyrinogen-III synthase [Sphingopyxis panaciterrae]|uniref:uroporphyrinogen-III synthase n=1 Tax=Sphingopyxis panaciterrae TaxID=363841 RepID=UPI001420A182|nr:uroporphyrinogen-III synthase [Sphingopyxis panaciterrae]NIJ39195.1 uroporphyrinogen-III synthase [Sphingopyxis panaciterrae]
MTGLPLIVTRPDPGGAATVARAATLGLDAHHMPLFAAHALSWTAPDPADFDAMLLTSAQAVRLAGADLGRLAALPVHAVGAATAQAARGAGLSVAMTGESDAQDLLDAMAAQAIGRILWLCGRDRSAFDARGAWLTCLPCYAVDPVPPPAGWPRLIAAPAVLLAHSTRGAARIADLAGVARKHLKLVAISAKAAAAAGDGWAMIAISDRPDDAAMLAEAHALCHKGGK